MSELQLVSDIVLWLLMFTIVIAILTWPRKGVINEKKLALQNYGLPTNDLFPSFEGLYSINGRERWSLSETGVISLFTSAGCDACNGLYPIISKFSQDRNITIHLFIEGSDEQIQQKIAENDIKVPVFKLNDLIQTHVKVTIFPFGYYLSKDGVVYSKGGVQNEEHLDLLIKEGSYFEHMYSAVS